MNFLAKIISTFFYIGYLPLIPGTFGSLAGLLIYFLLKESGLYLPVTLVLIILGFLFSGKAERLMQKKDPPCVVIDEVSGMLLSLAFLPFDYRFVVSAFILFRVFDILKPYPAKALQNLKGGLGIMADDIMAALYVNIILQLALRIMVFRGS